MDLTLKKSDHFLQLASLNCTRHACTHLGIFLGPAQIKEPTLSLPVGWKQSGNTRQLRVAGARAQSASPALLGQWMGLTHFDITLQVRGMPFPTQESRSTKKAISPGRGVGSSTSRKPLLMGSALCQ